MLLVNSTHSDSDKNITNNNQTDFGLSGFENQTNPSDLRTEITIFAKYLPPVESFVVSIESGKWTYGGTAAFWLHIMCENLRLRPIIDSSTTIPALYSANYKRRNLDMKISRYLRLENTQNYIRKFNQK